MKEKDKLIFNYLEKESKETLASMVLYLMNKEEKENYLKTKQEN